MGSVLLLGLVLFTAVLAVVAYVLTKDSTSRSLTYQERDELLRLRMLVDDLKETAWDHRELDSPLSTIIIGKIRDHERRGRELGP